jgi:Protein of unknown function (DUF2471)
LLNEDDPDNSGHFERSVQRAITDLQRIVATLAHRFLQPRRSTHPATQCTLSWRALLEIEEQAFSDLGLQARHDQAIIDGFLRLSDRRLPGAGIDETVD